MLRTVYTRQSQLHANNMKATVIHKKA